jgi:hypothetical protein
MYGRCDRGTRHAPALQKCTVTTRTGCRRQVELPVKCFSGIALGSEGAMSSEPICPAGMATATTISGGYR